MAESKKLFSGKSISKIILPLMFQNILAVTVGMADSLMVAGKGEDVFSGVSLVGTLDVLLITLFSSLTSGGSVVLAQAFGKGNQEETRETAKQLLYATTVVAVLVSVVVFILREPLLNLLFGEANETILHHALSYFEIMTLSFPLLAIMGGVAAIFRVAGDSMTMLKVSLLLNVLNIAGNGIFIYAFNLDAAGAAWATFLSRLVGAVLLLIFVTSRKRPIYIKKLFRYRPKFKVIRSILRIGVPNGVEDSMFQLGRLATASLVSTLGSIAIAANSATLSLANFHYTAGGAVQATTIAVVGRCIGAGEKKQARRYALILLGISYGVVFGVTAFMSLFSWPLLNLYNMSREATLLALQLFLFHNFVSALIWPVAFCLPPAFRAASDARYTMVVSILSMWVFRVALAYLLALDSFALFGISIPGCGLGIWGVFLGMSADWIFRAAVFVVHYLKGKWLNKSDALLKTK